MTRESTPDLLALHAVRVMGFADTPALAGRFGLDATKTERVLSDAASRGWAEHTAFADIEGWSLTETGRAENERQLRIELERVAGRDEVEEIHDAFLPLNTCLQQACTDWQLRPQDGDPLAANDHSDPNWDEAVLDRLHTCGSGLGAITEDLSAILSRFCGYDTRFSAALKKARAGEVGWVDRTDIDSCHRVLFELHEDLIATLGLNRRGQA